MSLFYAPLSLIYGFLTNLRNKLYDWRVLRAVEVARPVIAVGNITVGGTGKTPVLIALVEKVLEKYPHVGVVSRGFKRSTTGTWEVELAPDAVKKFGDEPVLIKSRLPKVLVFVAAKRASAARELLKKNSKAVIFADDAFQHRSMKRDLNILLIDALDDEKKYRMLPWGRARERFDSAIARADFLILTKSNLLAKDEATQRMTWLSSATDKPILKAHYLLDGFSMGKEWQEVLSDKVYVVSAVARPDSIDRMLEGKLTIVKHKTFMDHHAFTNLEVEAILDDASSLGAKWIVCTEKDWVKLCLFPSLQERLWVMKLKLTLEGDTKSLYEKIDSLVRSSN